MGEHDQRSRKYNGNALPNSVIRSARMVIFHVMIVKRELGIHCDSILVKLLTPVATYIFRETFIYIFHY